MKQYRLFNIQWDTDDDDPKELNLPSEIIVDVEDDWNPAEDAADLLSDRFDFCVTACSFESVP